MKPSSQSHLRYFKVSLGLLFSLLFFQAIANGDDKDKKPGNAAENTSDLLKKKLIHQRLVSSGDPVFFVLRSNKQRAKQGEEVELTVSAHFLEEAHRTFVVYKELYGYTLRLIMPNGFVVTGGNFHDLLQGKVSSQNPTKHYTIKGYFENECSNCEFKLLRGTYDRYPSEEWVYKQSLVLNVPEEELIIERKVEKEISIRKDVLVPKREEDVLSGTNMQSTQAFEDLYEVSTLRYKNPQICIYDGNIADFEVDIANKSSSPATMYATLCYHNDIPLLIKQVTVPRNSTITVEFNYQMSASKDMAHVHISPNAPSFASPSNPEPLKGFFPQISGADLYFTSEGNAMNFSISTPQTTITSGTELQFSSNNCSNKIRWYVNNELIKNLNPWESFSHTFNTVGNVLVKGECVTTKNEVECVYPSQKTIIVQSNCNTTNPLLTAGGPTTFIKGNSVTLSATGCTSNIIWYRNNAIYYDFGNLTSIHAIHAADYKVTCTIGTCVEKTSNTITVTHSGILTLTTNLPTVEVPAGQTAILTASGTCNGVYDWYGVPENPNSNQVQVVGPGHFRVRCMAASSIFVFSSWAFVSLLENPNHNVPAISTENNYCLLNGQTKAVTGTCSTGTLYWGDVTTSNSSETRQMLSGSYTAKCCTNPNSCSSEVPFNICAASNTCDNLPIPTVTIIQGALKLGEYFEINASNCSGEIKWYKNNNLYKTGETSLHTNEWGNYHVTCTYIPCNGAITTSNTVTPSYVPLTIVHNVPDNEIVQGVPFELKAVGCADGWVQWSTAGGGTRTDNPIWESAPGLYKARCIKEDRAFSDWVSVFFKLRTATTPQISKSADCFYANQKVLISGTCPAGMTLSWLDGTYTSQFPAYKEVTPGIAYRAQCCNAGGTPTNCGSVVDISVCALTPDIQKIITDKDHPNTGIAFAAPNEPVLLTATGCSNGIVHWMYNGQNQYGNPVTVYGPNKYYAKCVVSDHSYSRLISKEVFAKTPGEVSIISSQSSAYPNQLITLTAIGCNGAQVLWRYTVGTKTITTTGRSIHVTGPNTYYARCLASGFPAELESYITITPASGEPKIIVNKSHVRPNETFTFQVDFSACPNYGWPGGGTKVTQNGITTNMWGWDPVTITGPAILEADCANASWKKATTEIFLAPGDNIRLVANKSKAKHNEEVVLTTYGCEYGYIEWTIGDNTITGSMAEPKREIKQTGPGLYKARCKEDFNANSELVIAYVEIDGNIMPPAITGPTTLCPNTPATYTTTGCPSGYYNAWSTLEQGGFTYGGNSVTVYLPQTIKLKCFKNDNSWTSDEKTFTIHPSIPDDIKATSNSPVVSGSTVQLAGTAVTGATYKWILPDGWVRPDGLPSIDLTKRSLSIPNVTNAQAGEYKLEVTNGGCKIVVSTRVDINLCDNLYIRGVDALTGADKSRLTRKSGKLNEYQNLILQVETFNGEAVKGVNYAWKGGSSQSSIIVNQAGHYTVNVTSPGGISCPLEIDVSAMVCDEPADFTGCGDIGDVELKGTERLKNLAVGDEFSTHDYIVRVTEVTSGSESSGWKGKGELVMNFLKIGSSPVIEIPLAVEFDGINLNQCYQLLAGPKVKTVFDPSWSNVVSVDDITDRLSDIYAEIKDLLVSDPSNTAALQAKVAELNSIKADLTSSGFTPEYITEQTTAVNGAIASVSCYVTAPGARSANTCTADDVVTALDGAENAQNTTTPAFFGDYFDAQGNYLRSRNAENNWDNLVIVETLPFSFRPLNQYNAVGKASTINRIFMYYWSHSSQLGYSPSLLKNSQFTVMKRPDGDNGDLSTSCLSNEIYVYIEKTNYIERGLQHKEYLKSTLYHEKFHLVERLGCPVNKDFKTYNEHLQVYYNQFQQPGFSTNLKPSWIKGLYITASNENISPMLKNYSKEAKEWINKFKALNLGL